MHFALLYSLSIYFRQAIVVLRFFILSPQLFWYWLYRNQMTNKITTQNEH